MAAELKDLRAKITALTWCFLESESRARGDDISEIVRQILSEWADERLHAHMEAQRLMASDGIAGSASGNIREFDRAPPTGGRP
jgi:hypothetical protein